MIEDDEEEEEPADVDAVEKIDFRRPVRREILFDTPSSRAKAVSYVVGGPAPGHLSIVELRLARFRLNCTEYSSTVRGLIVGQNPGKRTHPDLPLFPDPPTSSAGRLLTMSGMTPGEYLGGLYRRNLCDDRKWSSEAAAKRARYILGALFDMPRDLRVVLCGEKVSAAFGARSEWWRPFRLDSRQLCVVIPHPSGLNHVYNEEEPRLRTRAIIRWAALGERLEQAKRD